MDGATANSVVVVAIRLKFIHHAEPEGAQHLNRIYIDISSRAACRGLP